jgi:hypothetical protein
VPTTEVTVPDPPLAAIVIDPFPLVIEMFVPAVRVALVSVLPVVFESLVTGLTAPIPYVLMAIQTIPILVLIIPFWVWVTKEN